MTANWAPFGADLLARFVLATKEKYRDSADFQAKSCQVSTEIPTNWARNLERKCRRSFSGVNFGVSPGITPGVSPGDLYGPASYPTFDPRYAALPGYLLRVLSAGYPLPLNHLRLTRLVPTIDSYNHRRIRMS
jgi:hypothetical protein